jgi:hypothetical protein
MGRAAHRRRTTVGTLSPRSRGAWMDGRGRTLSPPTRERHAPRLPPAPAYSHQWDAAARPPQHPLLSRPAHPTGVAARGVSAHRRVRLLSTGPETTLRVVLHSGQPSGGGADLARVAARPPDSDATRRHRTGHRGCARRTRCPRGIAAGHLRGFEERFPLLDQGEGVSDPPALRVLVGHQGPQASQELTRLHACLWHGKGHSMAGQLVLAVIRHDVTPDAAAPVWIHTPVTEIQVR